MDNKEIAEEEINKMNEKYYYATNYLPPFFIDESIKLEYTYKECELMLTELSNFEKITFIFLVNRMEFVPLEAKYSHRKITDFRYQINITKYIKNVQKLKRYMNESTPQFEKKHNEMNNPQTKDECFDKKGDIKYTIKQYPLTPDECFDGKVNHPQHYNQYPIETIDMMISIWGKDKTIDFCLMNAFKYRMRIGHKDDITQDLEKEKWYLNKANELK